MSKNLLAHDVFFSLHDNSAAAQDRLIQSCKTYLTGHPGTVFFACGPLAKELNRDVNDLDFEVALHIVFDGMASHDAYQIAPRHNQFIEESKANWKKVRVFDSIVETA